MKANEFVKKHGLNKAKVLLSTQGKTIANLKNEYTVEQLKEYQGYIVSDDLMSLVELKRLIESHELVEKMGGLNGAKNNLSLFESSLAIGLYHGVVGANAEAQISELKQAIADVESCL